jgi:hypothetical protein
MHHSGMTSYLQKLKNYFKFIGIAAIVAGHILVFCNQNWFLQKGEADAFSKVLYHASDNHQINACPFNFPSFNIHWHTETLQSPVSSFVPSIWNFFGLFCRTLLIFIAVSFIFLISGEQIFRIIEPITELLAPPRCRFVFG